MTTRTTLVIPVFNEASRLSLPAFRQALDRMPTLDLLFVDDGSTDGSPRLLAAAAGEAGGRMRVLSLPVNVGKGEAVRRGLLEALEGTAELLGYWDADLAVSLEELPGFIEALERDAALLCVLGSRVRLLGHQIERRALRHYLGRVFATAASLVLRMPVYDTQCGAKLLRRSPELVESLRHPFATRWLFDVELLARLDAACGGRLADHAREQPLARWTDVGDSRLRARDMVRVPWDLFRVARRHGRRLPP